MSTTQAALIEHAKDLMTNGGSPAKQFLSGGAEGMRSNDVLRHEDWKEIDEALIGVARQRLIGVSDLISRGLRKNLGGLGVMFASYEQIGDLTDAEVDFAAATDGEKDSATFALVDVPVPITSKEFSINLRRQMASERGPGPAIDTLQVELAAEKVTERLEETLFNGYSGGALDGNSVYGYTTEPNINTEAGSDWGTVTNPTTDVIDAIDELEADQQWAPWVLYVATTQFGQLRQFFTDGSGDQAFDRVKRLNGIEDIRPADRLAAGNALLITLKKNTVDYCVGQDLIVVEWGNKGNLVKNFKVMTAAVPRVKADKAGKSGICTITGI